MNVHTEFLENRSVRLLQTDTGILVLPRENASASFEPFPLPEMSLSASCWLTALAVFFHSKFQRGIALHLILDCERHTWIEPLIPTQGCTSEGATWIANQDDFADCPSNHLICGSFQSGRGADLREIQARIPPTDGLHMFLRMANGHIQKLFFLRVQKQLRIVPGESVLVDDWVTVISAHQDRLKF